jgi:hypothetical protein
MARNEKGVSNALYVSPFLGVLSAKSKEPREGFKEVKYLTKDNGERTAYVKTFNSVSGMIRKVSFLGKEFDGKKTYFWAITLQDEEGLINVQLSSDTSPAKSWVKITPNIDITKEVELSCFKDKQNPDKTVLVVRQNDAALKFAYTLDNPNGMPQGVQRANGKWDFGAQEDWLYGKNLLFCKKVSDANPNFGNGENVEQATTQKTNRLGFTFIVTTGEQANKIVTIQEETEQGVKFLLDRKEMTMSHAKFSDFHQKMIPYTPEDLNSKTEPIPEPAMADDDDLPF